MQSNTSRVEKFGSSKRKQREKMYKQDGDYVKDNRKHNKPQRGKREEELFDLE